MYQLLGVDMTQLPQNYPFLSHNFRTTSFMVSMYFIVFNKYEDVNTEEEETGGDNIQTSNIWRK